MTVTVDIDGHLVEFPDPPCQDTRGSYTDAHGHTIQAVGRCRGVVAWYTIRRCESEREAKELLALRSVEDIRTHRLPGQCEASVPVESVADLERAARRGVGRRFDDAGDDRRRRLQDLRRGGG